MTEKTAKSGEKSRNLWRVAGWSTAGLMLMLPFSAMQVTDQVVWDVADFAIFGSFLVVVGVIGAAGDRSDIERRDYREGRDGPRQHGL